MLAFLILLRLSSLSPVIGIKKANKARKSGARGDGSSKTTSATNNTPPPLPPPTRPDEQLYWLDLTLDRKWDLRLNRPFDRAIGVEVHVHPMADSCPPFTSSTNSHTSSRYSSFISPEAPERDAEDIPGVVFLLSVRQRLKANNRIGANRSRGRF